MPPPYGITDLREIATQALWGAAGVRLTPDWEGHIDRWAQRRTGSQLMACQLAGDFVAEMLAFGYLRKSELRYSWVRGVERGS